jgi:hypothetical protein
MVEARKRYIVMCVLYLCTYCVYSIALGLVGILMHELWNIENNKEGVWKRELGY